MATDQPENLEKYHKTAFESLILPVGGGQWWTMESWMSYLDSIPWENAAALTQTVQYLATGGQRSDEEPPTQLAGNNSHQTNLVFASEPGIWPW